MSMTALLALMGVTVFIGLFVLKVGPAYFENMTVAKIVEDKSADESLMRGPRNKIYASRNQAYRTNSLYSLKAEDTIRLKRDAERGHVMKVAYERRSTLFANIDVVTVFGEPATGAAVASR